MNALVPTVPEVRHLLATLLLKPPTSASFVMQWSLWLRRHQAGAARAHYKKRTNLQL